MDVTSIKWIIKENIGSYFIYLLSCYKLIYLDGYSSTDFI